MRRARALARTNANTTICHIKRHDGDISRTGGFVFPLAKCLIHEQRGLRSSPDFLSDFCGGFDVSKSAQHQYL
ncbi:hypothetical protein JOB18_009485 [Solea senegalensis]|uniref:Uncharacterized protein n=1 Tax=Solea senegalensis TaxID=28829 RepID=A0AAV6R7N3_SOLSE|nr:hypothetical protein JOB18_009485 [Solea senegalensis]